MIVSKNKLLKETSMQGAITRKIAQIFFGIVKVDICRSQLWNPEEASKFLVKWETIFEEKKQIFVVSLPCVYLILIPLQLLKSVLHKRSLLIGRGRGKRYILPDFQGFSQLSNPPVWCQTLRVFLPGESLHFGKRQRTLLIYQTYQPESQTDSTRHLEFLKTVFWTFQFWALSCCSVFLMRFVFLFCSIFGIFLFNFFALTWQSCKGGKKDTQLFPTSAVTHVFAPTWQSAHSIKY